MTRNIESQPSPESDGKTLVIGEKEYKKGDSVNFDNGDGIEKDWFLDDFYGKEVKILKFTGGRDINPSENIYDRGVKIMKKTVPVEQFIKENNQ
jgi:hypothetical protein